MITDLNSYKDLKKAKKMEEGLVSSLKAFQVCLDTLKNHKKYVTVMESMSTISTSYKITEIQLKKCREFIKEHNND
jgi:hypothetical protein